MSDGEKLIQNYTPAEWRGRDAYCEIREKINQMRRTGLEPKCIWIGADTAAGMKALWSRACGAEWDEILPKMIAGVECKEGSTGGHDYLIEHYSMTAIAETMRRKSLWNMVDNPLQGTH